LQIAKIDGSVHLFGVDELVLAPEPTSKERNDRPFEP
jgi:hypothetical protein